MGFEEIKIIKTSPCMIHLYRDSSSLSLRRGKRKTPQIRNSNGVRLTSKEQKDEECDATKKPWKTEAG
jgi:hypothetical protein